MSEVYEDHLGGVPESELASLDALGDEWNPDEYERRTAPAKAPEKPAARPWRTPAERARAIGYAGPRVALGLPTLDTATRGGLRPGTFVVIGGAPGAGKTSIVVQVARELHARGHAVGVLASDEGADGLLIRWGQSLGLVRDDLERGCPQAREYLAREVDSERLLLVDQAEEDAVAIELLGERLASIAPATELPGVLVVDSIQTARTVLGAAAETPRARVEAAIAALRYFARAHGFVVLATSEMARSNYRGGGVPGTDAIASFKESGAVEYQADLLLALTTPKGAGELIDVEVPKNRLGPKPSFRLEIDHARATVREVDVAETEVDEDGRASAMEAARSAKVEAAAKAMLLALARQGSVPGQRELRTLVQGSTSLRAEAVAWLRARGRITGGNGEPIRAVAEAPSDARETES